LNVRNHVRNKWIKKLETKINFELKSKFPDREFHVDLQGEYEVLKEIGEVCEETIVLTSEIRILAINHFEKGTHQEKIQASKIATGILSGTS
jgi:hypothetical protein